MKIFNSISEKLMTKHTLDHMLDGKALNNAIQGSTTVGVSGGLYPDPKKDYRKAVHYHEQLTIELNNIETAINESPPKLLASNSGEYWGTQPAQQSNLNQMHHNGNTSVNTVELVKVLKLAIEALDIKIKEEKLEKLISE